MNVECMYFIPSIFQGRYCRLAKGHSGRHATKLDLCWMPTEDDDNCHLLPHDFGTLHSSELQSKGEDI